MISTRSSFIYGYTINSSNYALDFNEGSGELQATLNIGSYTFQELANEIARAMNLVGGQEYAVTINRATRTFTVSASSNFSLLVTTGTRNGIGVWSTIGFSSDQASANTYTGSVTGTEFRPQCKLQDYVDFEDSQSAQSASVNVTAGNLVEVVSFGIEKIAEFNIKYQTDQIGSSNYIEADASGVSNLRNFLVFATTKGRMEFFKDRDNKSSPIKVILESTPDNRDGVGFKLRKVQGLENWYESGTLKFRQVD